MATEVGPRASPLDQPIGCQFDLVNILKSFTRPASPTLIRPRSRHGASHWLLHRAAFSGTCHEAPDDRPRRSRMSMSLDGYVADANDWVAKVFVRMSSHRSPIPRDATKSCPNG